MRHAMHASLYMFAAIGEPDTFKTQTECCKVKFGGQCGFSGGPSGRTCWMPDAATKKCKLINLEATQGQGCNSELSWAAVYAL